MWLFGISSINIHLLTWLTWNWLDVFWLAMRNLWSQSDILLARSHTVQKPAESWGSYCGKWMCFLQTSWILELVGQGEVSRFFLFFFLNFLLPWDAAILGEHVKRTTLQFVKKSAENLRNAPAIYQGSVFSSDTQGGIHAVDMATGKHVWFTNLSKPIGQDNGNLATFWEKLRFETQPCCFMAYLKTTYEYLILFDIWFCFFLRNFLKMSETN